MDNITHTLVGAALGQAGLKRRTPLALTTLLIGANLPDVDGITYWTGGALGFRRGWTHGVLALLLLPLALTGLVLAGDRLLRRARRRRPTGTPEGLARGDADVRAPGAPSGRRDDAGWGAPAVPRAILLLAFLSVLTHPLLDWCNTYGVRLLMPFSGRWFYGDTWFIMDPWVWLVLALGVWLSARRGARGRPAAQADRPARWALVLVVAYGAFMLATGAAGRRSVSAARAAQGSPPADIMVAPVFGNPFVRDVLVREGAGYRAGVLHLLPWRVELSGDVLPIGLDEPAARAAASTPAGREFLGWARYPFFRVRRMPAATIVTIADARYGAGSWARTTVVLPAP